MVAQNILLPFALMQPSHPYASPATRHNDQKNTPESDFKISDVIGGIVIRIPT